MANLYEHQEMRKVAIVAGGFSSEREISLRSARMILNNISREDFDPTLVVVDSKGWRAVTSQGEVTINRQDFSYCINGEAKSFDVAFIIIHGMPGENGQLQGYFDMIGLPYTTGPHTTMAGMFSKFWGKSMLRANGFNTSDYVLLRKGETVPTEDIVRKLGLPLFVKPNACGSSYGISKVEVLDDLKAACNHARCFDDDILVERFLHGVEVTCGVIEINGVETALPLTEIVTDRKFFDHVAKYEGRSEEITPARIDPRIADDVQRQCVAIWKLFKFKGMIRVDFIIQDGDPYVLEVNSVPGFTEASIIPQQAAAIGLSKTDLIGCVLESYTETTWFNKIRIAEPVTNGFETMDKID